MALLPVVFPNMHFLERERERERQRETERERKRERQTERDRQRETERDRERDRVREGDRKGEALFFVILNNIISHNFPDIFMEIPQENSSN